jgi:ABC-2 type transport system permease protein
VCVLVLVDTMIGSIMTQVALVLTALGVVRERERGTIEQLMITPVRKLELMLGKTIPYLVIGLCDLVIVLLVSWALFNVPVRGSIPLLFGEALLFLTATLGMACSSRPSPAPSSRRCRCRSSSSCPSCCCLG